MVKTEYVMNFGWAEAGEDNDATNKRGADKMIALQMSNLQKPCHNGMYLFCVRKYFIDYYGDMIDDPLYWVNPLGENVVGEE